MAINPFKDSDLNDLQENIGQFFTDHFGGLRKKLAIMRANFFSKGREKITVMFIPHSEKKIVNFHISIFAISSIVIFTVLTVTVTSIMIISHSSTVKEVSILKRDGADSKVQVKHFKEEINRLYTIFQQFKPEITYLYSMTPNSSINTLWAKGGEHNSTPGLSETEGNAPSLELLNMQEIKNELVTTKDLVSKIKEFLKYRKKIIANTPSVWPVEGYIVSRYGYRNSPYSFTTEFHEGIDIEAFPGTEIRSTAPGTVLDVRWDNNLGLTVAIKHKYGFVTSYSHCQRASVEKGQIVSKGEVIGYVGRTGKTTQYICYYQIKIGTEFVDPMPYLNRINRQ